MNLKTVLVVDGGGRGSALCHKYSQSKHVSKIIAIPGNGMMQLFTKKPVKVFPNIKTTDINEIKKLCQEESVDLIDVAQDDAVAVGLVDALKRSNLCVFGPTKAAGQIEWDKAWR